jgi:hypothetical protein
MTHLKIGTMLVRPQWHGKPPANAKFVCYGQLLNPNLPKQAKQVHIWRTAQGYGYETTP